MTDLLNTHCEACRIDAPRVSKEEAQSLHKQIPLWEQKDIDGIAQLHRAYEFPDFVSALNFTNKVGELAESEGHHPALTTEWGKVMVAWWSHKICGLHRNDFIMAAKTDDIFASFS